MQLFEIIQSAILQLAFFAILPFLWWLLTAREKESFFKWIGLKKPVTKASIRKLIVLVLIVFVAYGVLSMQIISRIETDNMATNQFYKQGWAALPAIIFYAVIQTGLSEEIFFRGFLGKRLISKCGFAIGNTVQALVFGLLHGLPIGLASGNIWAAISLTLLPGAMGWFQGWMNEKRFSGSILPSWMLHSLMNIVSALSVAL